MPVVPYDYYVHRATVVCNPKFGRAPARASRRRGRARAGVVACPSGATTRVGCGSMRRSTYFVQFEAPAHAVPAFESLGAARVVEQRATAVRLQVGSAAVEVTALADDVFRVGLFGVGQPC